MWGQPLLDANEEEVSGMGKGGCYRRLPCDFWLGFMDIGDPHT